MAREASSERFATGKRASSGKALRTVLLAVLFHTYWPQRLSREEIIRHLSSFYGETAVPALYRDLATLTDCNVEKLPEPDSENLAEWCANQQRHGFMAISYDRQKSTFGLERSLLTIDISEEEARAFAALQEGFSPGTPYAEAVQHLLKRWEWLFSDKSRHVVQQKRKRRAHPVQLPLSPVVDYSQHTAIILALDRALEE